jgi:hypothetical protein
VITIAMSTVIGAPRERVWDALTNPAEMTRWDPRLLSCAGSPSGPLGDGDVMHCRYRVGNVPVQQKLEVLCAVPGARFEATVTLGLFRFRETCLLTDESRTQTRLSLRLAAPNAMPVVGGVIDRFDVRKMASERIDERLRVLREWCEQPMAPGTSTWA